MKKNRRHRSRVWSKISGRVVLLTFCSFVTAPALAADQIFVALQGIEGEASARGFERQIEASSWSFGTRNSGTTHTASGRGSGRPAVSDITFTHRIDSASPKLFEHSVTGRHLEQARITVLRPVSRLGNVAYLVIDMKNVLVSSVSDAGGDDGDSMETVTLNFESFKYSYRPVDPSGKALGTIDMQWNIAQNAPRF